jgi:hypothetical protein
MHQKSGNRTIEVFWDIKHAPSDLLKQCRYVLIVKREGATKKSVQDNPTAPDIYFGACVQSKRDDTN